MSSATNPLNRWSRLAPYFRSVLRIVAAFLFVTPGLMKMFSFPVGMPPGADVSRGSLLWCAGVIEVIGGPLMLVGLFTRPVAFILSGEMAVAYFYAHAPHGFWPVLNNGQPAVFLCFIWLYFSAAGAGPWSLDAWLRKKA